MIEVGTRVSGRAPIPSGVWALGFVSLFMDMSSELVHSLLPLLLVTGLGASALALGVIEGVAEATAMIVKVFSGTLSDILRRRKLLVVAGYGMAALTKPLFALAPTVGWIFTARFLDRVGKGIRGAPRDALIADLTPAEARGAAFGLRQSLDTVGAVLGPLAAVALLAAFAQDIRLVLWFATIPAAIAMLILVVAVREPARPEGEHAVRMPVRLSQVAGLPGIYWAVVAIGALVALARFSEAFLLLRAHDAGLTIALVPLVLAGMSVVYSVSAYPAGVLSDRIGRRGVFLVGLVVLVLADVVLAAATTVPLVVLGSLLWGLHMGLTQGLLATMVADHAPAPIRGTAFGVFNLISGAALLLASVVAGAVWDTAGAPATFLVGAALALLAALSVLAYRPQRAI